MPEKTHLLYVGDIPSAMFIEKLSRAVDGFGELKIIPSVEEIGSLFDIIVLDEFQVKNLEQTVMNLRNKYPFIKIVVVTITPTWKQSRNIFKAGADDYFPNYLNEQEIRENLKALITER